MTAPRYDVDAIATVQEYLDRSDWRVNANANQGYSLGGLVLNSAGKIVANYWLEHVYTPEIGAPHREVGASTTCRSRVRTQAGHALPPTGATAERPRHNATHISPTTQCPASQPA